MITLYTKPNCVQCDMTKKFFNDNNLEYVVEDITSDENAAQLAYFIAEGFVAAPIVVTDRGAWSGYQADKLKELV